VKLIFLNRFFHPDHSATSQMLSDVAFALAATGERVTIITSRQLYDAPDVELAAFEKVKGVEIHRVWTSHFGRANLIGRAIDYATFYLSATWTLWRLARRGDTIVAKTDPPMLSTFAAVVSHLRGARLVNWLQDVFPEVAQAVGLGSGDILRAFYPLLTKIRNRSLRSAHVNVVIGELMANRLEVEGIPKSMMRTIPNWADGSLVFPIEHADNRLRTEWGLDGKFVVGYSGNLGRAHEFETFLGAIALTEGRAAPGDVTWLFIGGGALVEPLKREVEARGLTSVLFRPYQSRERLAESLSVPDVHLVSLKPELEGLIVPSKFYGTAAAGRASIFIGAERGEIAQLLKRYDIGHTVPVGDAQALSNVVLSLAQDRGLCASLGARARRAFEENFDKPLAIERWQDVLLGLDATSDQFILRHQSSYADEPLRPGR
jgi:colanic acid biosynthesis glycosyl transferase WcaI